MPLTGAAPCPRTTGPESISTRRATHSSHVSETSACARGDLIAFYSRVASCGRRIRCRRSLHKRAGSSSLARLGFPLIAKVHALSSQCRTRFSGQGVGGERCRLARGAAEQERGRAPVIPATATAVSVRLPVAVGHHRSAERDWWCATSGGGRRRRGRLLGPHEDHRPDGNRVRARQGGVE